MRMLKVFENATSNGYIAGVDGDMGWAHVRDRDAEVQAQIERNAATPATLLFGRVTYEMMASYWPTPLAAKNDPVVAKGMNDAQKIVFSRTLASADWSGTTLVRDDAVAFVRALKKERGPDLVLLGSARLGAQLAAAGLVDAVELMVRPVLLGAGRTLFEGMKAPLPLRLEATRAFRDGTLLVRYAAA